jgi:antitoxin (DNA-binding transcriptional repressor) of toxin-antitoxin stability system
VIEITKRGRPVARLVAVSEPPSLEGSVTYLVGDEELISPTDVEWDSDR